MVGGAWVRADSSSKSLLRTWATGHRADHPPPAQGSCPTIKQNQRVLIWAEGGIASLFAKRLHGAVHLGETKEGQTAHDAMATASCGRQLPSHDPHPPGDLIQSEASLRVPPPQLLPNVVGAEAHPDEGELTRCTGRGLLTRLQQLGRRALVPQMSSPSPFLSKSVM